MANKLKTPSLLKQKKDWIIDGNYKGCKYRLP